MLMTGNNLDQLSIQILGLGVLRTKLHTQVSNATVHDSRGGFYVPKYVSMCPWPPSPFVCYSVPDSRNVTSHKELWEGNLAIEKFGDWKKLEILVQNQWFWNIVSARSTAAPRIGGRDNAAGIMIVWRTSPPLILHIHPLHQVATVTPSHVPLRRRGIIITIFHGIGTNCMVPSDSLGLGTEFRL